MQLIGKRRLKAKERKQINPYFNFSDKMNTLTVIIPFLNEGQEISNTLKNLRQTAGNHIDILLINDASYDGYDYESVARTYHAAYLYNPIRQGVAAARDQGIGQCRTPYFLLLDGHMRFYSDDWWIILISHLKNNERAIYCCNCLPLDADAQPTAQAIAFGATIDLDLTTPSMNFLNPQWTYQDAWPDTDEPVIPCILGAAYAGAKNYWNYLKGLSGLRMYGSDESYISIKVWMEGGSCVLLKHLAAGHIFRKSAPYPTERGIILYNRLLITETLFSAYYKNGAYNVFRQAEGIYLRDAMKFLAEAHSEIQELEAYYRKIRTRTFESFVELNESVIRVQKSKPDNMK